MAETSFHFNLGKFGCIIVSDGTIIVPDRPSPKPTTPAHIQNGKVMDVLCLFIDTGKQTVLVDTGCGNSFQSTAGKLVQNLKLEGINSTDINTIIYTHGHADHLGGSFDSKGRAVFPNARHAVLRKEWEHWANGSDKSKNWFMFASARKTLLLSPDQFDLIEDNSEVLPGFKLINAFGHTPGNAILEISSGTKQLLCIGDLVHTQFEFSHPEYYSFLDSEPEQAINSRAKFLSQIAKSGILTFGCHFPFPGLGYLSQQGNALEWQPIRSSPVANV